MDKVLDKVRQELRAFVGQTIFEELAQDWVTKRGKADQLPFTPDIVGSHWSRRVQCDVVAVNWQARQILLGECKWGHQGVDRSVIRDLVERKTDRLQRDLSNVGEDWQIHYTVFSRAGFTDAALEELAKYQGTAVDLSILNRDL